MKNAIHLSLVLFWAVQSLAAPVTFTLDPTQSSITASGNAAGNTFQEQGPGSLTARYEGTIKADLGSSTIQFLRGSAIDALVSGNWQPRSGGAAGTEPADYGAQASSFLGTVRGAFRNILLDVSSQVINVNPNGTFDSSSMTFIFPTNSNARFDYNAGFASGSRPFAGESTNRTTTTATLTTTGDSQRLVIPVRATFFFRTLADGDSTLNLDGQLVATRTFGPRFSSITLSNQLVVLRVTGITAEPFLESSFDLRTWTPRTAETRREGSEYVVVLPPAQPKEFFRARN